MRTVSMTKIILENQHV